MLSASRWSGLLAWREISAGCPALEYPLPAAERIAVIGVQLRAERCVRSYPQWRTPALGASRPQALESWKPQALAGHRSELFSIGELRRRGHLSLAELALPLVVLSSLREGPLSAAQHDRLWSLYGLPVYEQIRAADETLLAWECDAREGWHLALNADGSPKLTSERVRAAGWQGNELPAPCPCGETCLRLMVDANESVLSLASGAD